MTTIKKALLTGTFAAALLLAPTYASANTKISNANLNQQATATQMYHALQHTQVSVNSDADVSQFGTPQYNVQNQMRLGSKRSAHMHKTTSHNARNRRFANMYLQGHGDGSAKQDMRASRLARHNTYFHRAFLKYATNYYSKANPSRSMRKQLRISWRILKRYSKRSKTYRKGWYTIDSNPVKHLRHNKLYHHGFRDSMYYKYGLRVPVKSYFKEFMSSGKIKD